MELILGREGQNQHMSSVFILTKSFNTKKGDSTIDILFLLS